MTRALRTAEIDAERFGEPVCELPIEARRAGIVDSPMAHGRALLALSLAWRRGMSVADARMALSAAPLGMDVNAAQAWASHLVSPAADSLGVTHGH